MTCFSLLGTDFQTVCVLVTVSRPASLGCAEPPGPGRASVALCLPVLPHQSLSLLPHISRLCFAPVWLGKAAQAVFPVSRSVPRTDLSKDNRQQWWHAVRKAQGPRSQMGWCHGRQPFSLFSPQGPLILDSSLYAVYHVCSHSLLS